MTSLRPFAIAALVLVFALLGLGFPDLDQPLPLDHRSALTHSVAPAALCMVRRWARPIAAGLALGIGFHLAADVFPNAMTGYAMVKLPFAGSIGAAASYAWLAVNAVVATMLGMWLVRTDIADLAVRRLLVAALAAMGILYLLATDGGWTALAVIAGAVWLMLRLSSWASSGNLRVPGRRLR